MDLYVLYYASRALVDGPGARAAVSDIVRVSQDRNERLNVTGALLYSGGHFAQLLEGPRPAVKELMASIERDPRHRDVRIVREEYAARRSFASWSLAYSGPSSFIDGTIAAALTQDDESGRSEGARLRRLFDEFALAQN